MLKNVIEIKHPLLKHKLGYLRDKNTSSSEFRNLMNEIAKLLAYGAMKDWDVVESISVETPLAQTHVERIKNAPVAVSIMRAGNGMLDGVS